MTPTPTPSLRERLGARVLRLVPALRRSLDQVASYAVDWEQVNDGVLAAVGPRLWAVLGDSTAQAVGTPGIDRGYVGRVQRLLELRDGEPWQVLNLSRSGAVVADVLDVQLPTLARLGVTPALVTAVIGGNDLRRTPEADLLARLTALVQALPAGAVVATMPRGLKEAKARAANALLRAQAPARGLLLADLWAHTGPPWRGRYADGLHPNEVGLAGWVAALGGALGLDAEADPPSLPARRRRRGSGLRAETTRTDQRGPG